MCLEAHRVHLLLTEPLVDDRRDLVPASLNLFFLEVLVQSEPRIAIEANEPSILFPANYYGLNDGAAGLDRLSKLGVRRTGGPFVLRRLCSQGEEDLIWRYFVLVWVNLQEPSDARI